MSGVSLGGSASPSSCSQLVTVCTTSVCYSCFFKSDILFLPFGVGGLHVCLGPLVSALLVLLWWSNSFLLVHLLAIGLFTVSACQEVQLETRKDLKVPAFEKKPFYCG